MGHLYTHMKVFHYKDKIDSLPADTGEILPPIHIRIKPTNVCNHSCGYCAYRRPELQLGCDMRVRDSIPREKMMEVVEDIVEMGVQAVTFSGGGEPFCYPHLLEVVQRLADSPIRFAALTNGSRLRGAVAEFFARRATWLRVSIDGWDGPSYAGYRGVAEDQYTVVLDNIRRFKDIGGGCHCGASIIVDRQNAPHVDELIETLRTAGVDSVKVSPCIVSNDGAENNRYHEPIFDCVKEQIGAACHRFQAGGLQIYDSYHRQLESFRKDYSWCPYCQILPVIGADQNVYTCQDKAYNLDKGRIGSIAAQRFRDLWFSGKEQFLRINPMQDCSHHCVADGKNRSILQYIGADVEHRAFV